ncbi:MAG: hypothetical protein WC668_02395 [Patescibacteria group bacterium]|jgi:hypothetical protein
MVKHRTTGLSRLTTKIVMAAALIAALVLTGAATTGKSNGKTPDRQTETKENKTAEEKIESVKPEKPNPAKEKLELFLAQGEIPVEKMYVGTAGMTALNPRCIDYSELVMATPSYRELKERKLAPSSGAYWLLISQGSDTAWREINKYAKKQSITLITDRENLVKLLKKQERFKDNTAEELIGWFDITDQISEKIKNLKK